MALLACNGLSYFWQKDLVELDAQGRPQDPRRGLGARSKSAAETGTRPAAAIDRIRLKIGNRDVSGLDFVWIDAKDIAAPHAAPTAWCCSSAWSGGTSTAPWPSCGSGGQVLAARPASGLDGLRTRSTSASARAARRSQSSRRGAIGDVNYAIERLRLAEKKLDLEKLRPPSAARRKAAIERRARRRAGALRDARRPPAPRCATATQAETLVMRTADGETKEMPVGTVVARPPAQRHGQPSPSCGSTARAAGSSSPATRASPTPRAASSRPSSAP